MSNVSDEIIPTMILLILFISAYLAIYEYRRRKELLGARIDVPAFFAFVLIMIWEQELTVKFSLIICAISILGLSIFYGYRAMDYYKPKISVPKNEEEFRKTLVSILNEAKNYIEKKRGYKLLWNDDGTHKKEIDVHIFFGDKLGPLCRQKNIDMSREALEGTGLVDFKFSATHSYRACLELKLSSHRRLKHGLTNQLPDYMEPEGIKIGIFVVVLFDKEDERKVKQLLNEKEALEEKHKISLEIIIIDATRDKESASVPRRSPNA
ncbi:MAG: hypothetical protein HXS44_09960 [Theionarchaea archaeon]|nr:hypothetical protein [Theionarchaea archaeon]